MKILWDAIGGILKTFDDWYDSDYMLYVLIGLFLLVAYIVTKLIFFVIGEIGKIPIPIG